MFQKIPFRWAECVTTYWFLRPCTSLTRGQKYTWSLVLSQLTWYYCWLYQCLWTKNGESLSCKKHVLFLICFQISFRIYMFVQLKRLCDQIFKQRMNNTIFGAVILEVVEARGCPDPNYFLLSNFHFYQDSILILYSHNFK